MRHAWHSRSRFPSFEFVSPRQTLASGPTTARHQCTIGCRTSWALGGDSRRTNPRVRDGTVQRRLLRGNYFPISAGKRSSLPSPLSRPIAANLASLLSRCRHGNYRSVALGDRVFLISAVYL